MKETVDFSSWCSRRLNAVLFVAMMMAMSVQGCDLALMVLHSASIGAWSLLTEMGYQILQTGMMMVAFNALVFILFYLRDYLNLFKVEENFNEKLHHLKTLIEMVNKERSSTQGSTSSENQPDMIRKLAEVIEMENYGMNLMVEMSTTYYLKEKKKKVKNKNKKTYHNSRTSRRQPTRYTSGGEPTEDEFTEDAMDVDDDDVIATVAPLVKRWRPTE